MTRLLPLIILLSTMPSFAAVIPAEPDNAISLNGKWRFKLEQSKGREAPPAEWNSKVPIEYPATFEPFFKTDYQEDANWHDLDVPGNWEMAGYSVATYGQPDNASGFYRYSFEIPAAWQGRLVMVNFDGVQNGTEIWLNGQPVKVTEPSWGRENYHESGWTAWQADLTPQVKFGQKNLLALRVTKNTTSADLDSGDYFFLGGVHRPVTLFSIPQSHLSDITITTKLLDGGKAEVKLAASVANGKGTTVSLKLEGVDGTVSGTADGDGRTDLSQAVNNAQLWSAEFPNLYNATIELKDAAGKTIETVTRHIGIREVSIKNGVYMINNVRVQLAGMCRHDVWPTKGTAVDDEVWRKDITLMKAANVNCIRTSHYPYGTRFYDLCDEMGIYVVDEIPYCWCPTNVPELFPAFLQRCREAVARDKNHACVVMWGIGNENAPGPALQHVADLLKTLDTTRPRLVSRQPAEKFNVELADTHYTLPANMTTSAAKSRQDGHPHMYTEEPNVWDLRLGADPGCWDAWAAVLARHWAVVEKEDSIPGLCVWEWQDRAVADPFPTKLYYFDAETGINHFKLKGIVDAWRNPRPHYYHTKMIFSPIKVEKKLAATAADSVTLAVANHYSFTDLSNLKADWQLFQNDKEIGSGSASLKLPPHTSNQVALALPNQMLGNADTLRVSFDHPDGRNISTYQFTLKEKPATSTFEAKLPDGLTFPRLNLVSDITKGDKAKWRAITRYRGQLLNIKTEPSDQRDLYTRMLADIHSVDADIALDNNPSAVVGRLHAEYANNRFTYRIEWSGANTSIQELGWTFTVPKSFDHFSWKRQGCWSYYPETHIGRLAGTALPDTANVHYTNWNRLDAFDFNSTKYNCDWASLTDSQGHGLRVEFAPEQRHQCRGGMADGGYQMIVNKQCSPPNDISTRTVADLYLTLKAGDKVESSFRIGSQK